jgi:hypothetical protein
VGGRWQELATNRLDFGGPKEKGEENASESLRAKGVMKKKEKELKL